jgi:hypothetical protein
VTATRERRGCFGAGGRGPWIEASAATVRYSRAATAVGHGVGAELTEKGRSGDRGRRAQDGSRAIVASASSSLIGAGDDFGGRTYRAIFSLRPSIKARSISSPRLRINSDPLEVSYWTDRAWSP